MKRFKAYAFFIITPVIALAILGALAKTKNCKIETEQRIVRGNSLSPFIQPGQEVKILFGYYSCHKVEKEDIVAYRYKGDYVPLVKIVKGLPGDRFRLKKFSNNKWHILINGKIVRNSQGQFYIFTGERYRMLSLYEKDYQGIIPENTYLLLGNLINGSLDSSRFGLIDKSDILGKVEL